MHQHWQRQRGVAFVWLMMLLLLALLKVDVVFTHCAHSASATDTRPRCSDFHTEADTERKAIPTVCAPPHWILGQPAFARRAAGKPRLPGLQVLQHRWLFEAWKWKRASACARITCAPHPLCRWRGGEFRRPLSLCQHRLKPTLCSHLSARIERLYLCVSLLTYWQPLCWGNWCITSACARVTLEKRPQASIVAVSQLNQRSPLASKCHSGGKRNSHNIPLRSFSADKNTAVMCLESRTCLQWEWTSPVWKCLSVCSEVRGGWSRMKAGGRPYPPSCPSFLSAVVCR